MKENERGGDIHPLDKFLKIFLSNADDRIIAKSVYVSEQRFITHINMYFKNKYKKYLIFCKSKKCCSIKSPSAYFFVNSKLLKVIIIEFTC